MKKFLIVVLLAFCCHNSIAQKLKSDWLIIYYMPYDNDLSDFAPDIAAMIQDGVTSEKVNVVLQADISDSLGMQRILFKHDTVISQSVRTEHSAHTKTFSDFLLWTGQNFEAKKYAIIFLNHGGELDEIGLDEYPSRQWLRLDSLRQTILQFNHLTGKKAELIGMQVCSKGSLEALYEFKDCANYTFFSQFILGAPNYYYTGVLKHLSDSSNIDGMGFTQKVAEQDSLDMYLSYTCVDNRKMDSLAIRFNQYIATLQEHRIKPSTGKIRNTTYSGQMYWDIVSILKNIRVREETVNLQRKNLIRYIKKELIAFNYFKPTFKPIQGFSGISILSMREPDYDTRYSHLSFFKDVHLKMLAFEIRKKVIHAP
jgi:hypothetical protein